MKELKKERFRKRDKQIKGVREEEMVSIKKPAKKDNVSIKAD